MTKLVGPAPFRILRVTEQSGSSFVVKVTQEKSNDSLCLICKKWCLNGQVTLMFVQVHYITSYMI